MATDPPERQFYLHLFDHTPELSLQQMKVRTLQCFDPTTINNIPRIDWLLVRIEKFRKYKYDSRQWLLRQELALRRRRKQLALELKQSTLF